MLKQAAQGGSWVTFPGGVQEMYRCTKGHCLVGEIG